MALGLGAVLIVSGWRRLAGRARRRSLLPSSGARRSTELSARRPPPRSPGGAATRRCGERGAATAVGCARSAPLLASASSAVTAARARARRNPVPARIGAPGGLVAGPMSRCPERRSSCAGGRRQPTRRTADSAVEYRALAETAASVVRRWRPDTTARTVWLPGRRAALTMSPAPRLIRAGSGRPSVGARAGYRTDVRFGRIAP
jgi:hypothetical protein